MEQGQKVENGDFAGFIRRAIRAHGRRVGDGDVDALPELAQLRDEVDVALAEAVAGLRAAPHAHSWQRIADALGVTRQAAMQRWPSAHGARRPGGQPADLR